MSKKFEVKGQSTLHTQISNNRTANIDTGHYTFPMEYSQMCVFAAAFPGGDSSNIVSLERS